jgi:IclR family transcriptional regulator, acetate operon repressor
MTTLQGLYARDSALEGSADIRSVLRRAVGILDIFSPSDSFLPLAEISRRSRLPKTTTHRLAAELVELGLLERGQYGYRVGLRMFELGQLAPRMRWLRERALPWLEDLQASTSMTVNLAVREGLDVLYIEILSPLRGMRLPSRIGARLPAHSSGLGKVILAYSEPLITDEVLQGGLTRFTQHTIQSPDRLLATLSDVRREGVAIDDGETVRGVLCLAAPVFGSDGQLIAAVSVTANSTRRRLDRAEPLVRATASGVSLTLPNQAPRDRDSHGTQLPPVGTTVPSYRTRSGR